jgi:branched-chain amino acid transport system ATP-binding protein
MPIWARQVAAMKTEVEPRLRIEDLVAGYGRKQVIQGVSFDVAPGEIVALLGANGAGKTTFMSAVVNEVRRFSGRVVFEGTDVSRIRTWRFASLGIAMVPQGIGVFSDLTVAENLKLARIAAGRDPQGETEEQIVRLFPILKEKWAQAAAFLSGGQRQMLAIGRALSAKPRLLLLDEPSLGLAPQAVASLMEGIVWASRNLDLAVILAEQDVAAAASASSRYYLLKVGMIASEGTVDAGFRERVAAEYLA